jgi:hypothetical protein
MARNWHKPLIAMMWLAFPAGDWTYWSVWSRLPERMAVHIDVNGQPNGYTSRQGAALLGLGILLAILVLFTLATLIIDTLKPAAFWPALLISYVVLGFCWYGNYRIVNFSLSQPLQSMVTESHENNSQFLVAEN